MPILVNCDCGQKLRAKDESAGRILKCPACGDPIKVRATKPSDNGVDLTGQPVAVTPEAFGTTAKPPKPRPQPSFPELDMSDDPFVNPEWKVSERKTQPATLNIDSTGRGQRTVRPAKPTASFSSLLAKHKKVILGLSATVLCLAGVVAVLMVYQPWREEPKYEGKPLSEWAAMLKDSSPATQERAVLALGSLGVESYPYMNDILFFAVKAEDADSVLAAFASLRQIAYGVNTAKEELQSTKDAAKVAIRKILPELKQYQLHAEEMRRLSREALEKSRNGESVTSRETDLRNIRDDRMWSQIAEQVPSDIRNIEYIVN